MFQIRLERSKVKTWQKILVEKALGERKKSKANFYQNFKPQLWYDNKLGRKSQNSYKID